ncbi:pentatricopeptide repeat-containing protein At2g13600 [Cryptomeria japonica]|uniref:pentatricopeptide repeat-containing protein At2g13600 n=1 Tax=Cryptomeria japonica TaxID=3369 RepID=UPI0025AC0ED2|nr:pentatricopeptide repeat-containing protein At2g13600 [Cryptomeria japonica]XP_057816436.1 pentatricopeptide repeat-containing protein At2g13600 [Cryptomeria japonica]
MVALWNFSSLRPHHVMQYKFLMSSAASLNVTALCREGWFPVVCNRFPPLLRTCFVKNAFLQGKKIHSLIADSKFISASYTSLQNKLINMYVKCGSLVDAHKVFDGMKERDSISWNTIIAAYQRQEYLNEALILFTQMQRTGVQPDHFTFATILPACAKTLSLDRGMDVHQSVIEGGFLSDVVVASALVDMYAKCGSVHKARELFDKIPQKNVVSWTAMITGYAQNGALDEALKIFKEMPGPDIISWNAMVAGYAQNGFVDKAIETFKQLQMVGLMPNSTTFASILSACAKVGALEQGMDIHQSIVKTGFSPDIVVASALVDMYAKCGRIHKARELFDKMPQRNVISWTAMIAGYAQNGFFEKALETFNEMHLAGINPNSTTFAGILQACAKVGALEQGTGFHQRLIESGLLSETIVVNALIDMYAKCGSIHKAWELFDKMPQRSVISWNAMITGYAQNGYCKNAFTLFELMKYSGTDPDRASFACVIFACSHAGLVDEGCKYFESMSVSYCITRIIDHYVCMVDLLGRAGYLEESLNFIIKMPIKPLAIVWMCLLGACKSYKNIVLGVFTANLLFELDPKNAATYVLLSNIYAELGKWGEVQKIRRLIKDRGIKKVPGCSWIEVDKKVHVFV